MSIKKSDRARCVIQAIGLVLLFFFPIGTFLGVCLLIYGGLKANKLIYSLFANGDGLFCTCFHPDTKAPRF